MDLKRVSEGLTVVALGALLLANTLGYLPWSIWWNIMSLWPLLIVAAGIDLIGRSTDNTWLRVLSSLLVIGGLMYGALIMSPSDHRFPFIGVGTSSEPNDFDLSEPHDPDVRVAEATVSGGAGEFSVAAGHELVSAEGETPFDEPLFDVTKSGDEAKVDVSLGEGSTAWPVATRSRLDVLLDDRVVWDLTLKAGVSASDIDLTDVMLSALILDAGVSDTAVRLGRIESGIGVVPVEIDAGVSSIRVRIPKGAQARVLVRGGLSAIDVDSGLRRISGGEDKRYETTGFDDGDAYYDIVIDAGVGSIVFDLY